MISWGSLGVRAVLFFSFTGAGGFVFEGFEPIRGLVGEMSGMWAPFLGRRWRKSASFITSSCIKRAPDIQIDRLILWGVLYIGVNEVNITFIYA